MSKYSFAAATAVLGLALVAGVTHRLTAADEGPIPPLTIMCYYNGTTCTYSTGNYGYWDQCDTTYPHTEMSTNMAKRICGRYNQS